MPRHGLPPRQFDALAAGGGGAATIAHLWDAERSRRLLLLSLLATLVDERAGAAGPLDGIGRAWEVLSSAEQRSRAVTDDLLLLPQTGQWLRQALVRLQAADGDPDDVLAPLWVDVGQLHLTAAAAAVRTGLAFSLLVPARSGGVWLPSVGYARLPGRKRPWEAVEAQYDGRLLIVGHGRDSVRVVNPLNGPAARWRPERALAVDSPSGPKRIALSDTGPYRLQQDVAPPALTEAPEASVQRWAELVQHAMQVLARADPQGGQDVAACLRSLEPLPPAQPFRWRSATMADSMGGLAASEPVGTVEAQPAEVAQFAAVLTHEVQHSKLSALLHMYTLHQPDAEARFYAPWRDDPRPLRGMLHGVYAFTAVARFWRGHVLGGSASKEHAALAAFEYALRRRQLQRALVQMVYDDGLTSLGRRVVEQLAETVESWGDEAVGNSASHEAERAVADHAVSWRLHHLVPDQGLVTGLARTWLSRATPGDAEENMRRIYPPPQLLPDKGARGLDARAVLMRMLLSDTTAHEVRALRDLGDAVQGARYADLLLLEGDLPAAEALYTTEIASSSPAGAGDFTAGAWAGLRLVLEAEGARCTAVEALTHAPELVRGVYEAVRGAGAGPTDPVAVADWIGHQVIVRP